MMEVRRDVRTVLGITDSITSGAALVQDGRVIAAVSEERLNRKKMAMGWPRLSIDEVLRLGGVEPQDVDEVAVATRTLYWRPECEPLGDYFDGRTWGIGKKSAIALGGLGATALGGIPGAGYPYYCLKSLLCINRRLAIRRELQRLRIQRSPRFIDHHLAHAASAYYTGGRDDAMVATLDGAGDHVSATIYRGSEGALIRVRSVSSYHSIGNFYSYVTQILGFKAHQHEGKVTGLAAYGLPIYADVFRRLVRFRSGTIENLARAFHGSAIRKIRALLPLSATREDIAASIQLVLEEVCTDFVRHWAHELKAKNLQLAGGVVANVKLNQRLLADTGVSTIYIHPGMGDDGLAVGAALHQYAQGVDRSHRPELVHELPDAYLGPSFDEAKIRKALGATTLRHEKPLDLAARVAQLIAAKQVVARFDGRMEYGPRALGNRSILVHAGDPTVNEWLNHRLQRTEFMPFAPVTLEEDAPACYKGLTGAEHTSRFMTITCDCTPQLKETCPAVVHVDGTARPQLVGRRENPGYRGILEEYRKITGFSTMINTSFNMHEEPIVCTLEDALRAFTLGNLDYLVLGDYLVEGPRKGTRDIAVRPATPRIEVKSRPRALVTGATGFTGGHLALALLKKEHRVRALVRPQSDVRELLKHGIEVVEGQLTNSEDVGRAMQGVDVVYHLAAAYREAKHPDSYYFDVNVGGTERVLRFARSENVRRVVHCSTVGVHGEVTSIPADEGAPLAPADAYQSSKLDGERLAQKAFADGLPGVIFRPCGIYGPGDRRFLKLFRAIHTGRFRMFGSGDILYHLTYIDDLIDGILLCGERAEAVGSVYILAGPSYTSLKELVRLIAEAVERPCSKGHLPVWPLLAAARVCELTCRPLGIDPPLHRRRCDFFTKDRAFSCAKAQRELGYAPCVDLEEGLLRTARWYFQQGLLESHRSHPHATPSLSPRRAPFVAPKR